MLSFEIGEAICAELLPLAERAEEYAAKLQADGFEAVLLAREWLEGFCSCERDKELHRFGVFIAAAQKYLGSSGFSFERKKSRPKHPAVVKPVGFGWELRWLVFDVTTFDYEQPHPNRDGWPKFDPWLVLCHSNLGSDLGGKGRGNFLRIHYTAIIREFFGAYRTFFTGPELEVLIKVHACFLGQILGDVEASIRRIISKP